MELTASAGRQHFFSPQSGITSCPVQQAQLMVSRVPRGTLRVTHGHGHICLIAPEIDLAEIVTAWRESR